MEQDLQIDKLMGFHRIFVCRRCKRQVGGCNATCSQAGVKDFEVEKVDCCAVCNHKQKEKA